MEWFVVLVLAFVACALAYAVVLAAAPAEDDVAAVEAARRQLELARAEQVLHARAREAFHEMLAEARESEEGR